MIEKPPEDQSVPHLIRVVPTEGDGIALSEHWSWEVADGSAPAAVLGAGRAPTAVVALEAAIEHLMGFEFPGGPTLQHTKAQRFRYVMARRHQLARLLQQREAEILAGAGNKPETCPECDGAKKDAAGGKCVYCGGKGRIRRKGPRMLLQSLSTSTRTQLGSLEVEAKMLGVAKPPPESDGGAQADEFAQWQKGKNRKATDDEDDAGA